MINPGSVILSGVMLFRFLGWNEAADLIERGLEQTIEQKKVTYDFERLMEGAKKVKTSEFASDIIENMQASVTTGVRWTESVRPRLVEFEFIMERNRTCARK